MKTFEEIDPHLQIILDIDQRKDSGGLDRRRAISGLVYRLADELIAGHPAPRSDDPGYFTRIDGLVPALANELVRQNDMAIVHRTHLAERLEADGGENGAKAAAILRAMNVAAEPSKEDDLPTSGDLWPPRPTFQIHFVKTHGEGGGGCGVPVAGSGAGGGGGCSSKNFAGQQRAVYEAGAVDGMVRHRAHMVERAREEGCRALEEDRRIKEAEKRGFYQGRNKAWIIVMNRLSMMPGLHEDGQAVLRAVSESIAMMQKEG